MEELTLEICREYQEKAKRINNNNRADIGARRQLREELQNRCGIPEIWALNIINGYYCKDYIALIEYKKKGGEIKENRKDGQEYLEWLSEKESEDQIKEMLRRDELVADGMFDE